MNDLLSRSFSSRVGPSPDHHEMPNSSRLESFFLEVESVKEELKQLERDSNKDDVLPSSAAAALLNKAKPIKARLEALDRSNEADRNNNPADCGPGSSEDRTRTSEVNGLRKKLKELIIIIMEIRPPFDHLQERYEEVSDLEKNLRELHQMFLDLAVLMEPQGDLLDDIESHVASAHSYIKGGTQQVGITRKLQVNTRQWVSYYATLVLIIIVILIIILFVTIFIIIFSAPIQIDPT